MNGYIKLTKEEEDEIFKEAIKWNNGERFFEIFINIDEYEFSYSFGYEYMEKKLQILRNAVCSFEKSYLCKKNGTLDFKNLENNIKNIREIILKCNYFDNNEKKLINKLSKRTYWKSIKIHMIEKIVIELLPWQPKISRIFKIH